MTIIPSAIDDAELFRSSFIVCLRASGVSKKERLEGEWVGQENEGMRRGPGGSSWDLKQKRKRKERAWKRTRAAIE